MKITFIELFVFTFYFFSILFGSCFIFLLLQFVSEAFPKWEWACYKMGWHIPPIKRDKESLCPRCKQKVEWNAHAYQWMTEKESAVHYANISPDICDMAP